MPRALLAVAFVAIGWAGCKKKSASDPGCPPSVSIRVDYPGASPAEVEAQVIAPIEAAIAGLEAVASIHALAREGGAVLEVEVAGDAGRAAGALRAALERGVELPDDVELPRVRPVARLERLILAIGPVDPQRAAEVEAALERLDGVRSVTGIGARAPEIRVTADPERLAALRIDAARIVEAVRRSPRDPGAAVIEDAGGQPIAVRDVAEIAEGVAAGPAVYLGGERVAVLAISLGDEIPPAAALREAGAARVSRPIAVTSCPRGLARRFDVATAWAPSSRGIDAALIARRFAAQPVLVLHGADLGDRGIDGVEVIALEPGAGVERVLRGVPGLAVIPANAAAVHIEVTAEASERLEEAARAIEAAARRAGGVAAIERVPAAYPTEIRVETDREAARRYGIRPADIAVAVRRAVDGEVAAIRRDGGRAVPIRVFAGEPSSSPQQLLTLRIETPNGAVPITAVARISAAGASPGIYRRDRRRRIRLRLAVTDGAAAGAVRRAIAGAATTGASVSIIPGR